MRSFEEPVRPLRLLDLVCAVQDVAANDREVVAALRQLLDPPLRRRGGDVATEHGREPSMKIVACFVDEEYEAAYNDYECLLGGKLEATRS